MAQSKEQMNGGEAPSPKPYYDRRITILCIGTALMDFTSHIASQATPAYAISMLGGDMEAVAVLISYCTATGAVVEFLINPWLGKLSDAYGRMLPLLLCPALNGIARFTPPVLGLSKAKLMFGRGTAGGARAAYLMAVNAAIADMVPAEERTAVFGKLGAFIQASFMVGMFSAGEVTKRYSPKVAYMISGVVSAISLVLMYFGMTETLPEKAPFKAPNPFSFVDLLNPRSIYNKTTAYSGGKLAVVLGLQKGTGEPGLTDAKNLYNRSVVGWDDAQRGNFLAFEGLAMMVANSLTGRVVKAIGPSVNFFAGSILKMAQYLVMGLTKSGSVLYATLPLAIPLETSQSVTSALTAIADETNCGQGRLSGDVQNMQAVVKIIMPIVYGRLFAYGLSRGLGGLAHFFYVGAWGLSMLVYATVPRKYQGSS